MKKLWKTVVSAIGIVAVLTGCGQDMEIAVDLGEGAEENLEAVVNLVLDGVDINCSVAPAVIFYNVYECGSTDKASWDVDTSAAGANVIISDDTVNCDGSLCRQNL